MAKKYEFEPLEAFRHAERLRQSALAIGWVRVEWSRLKGDFNEGHRIFYGQTTLLALSIEILIKCLGSLSEKSLKGHDLEALFLGLAEGDRDAIQTKFESLGGMDVLEGEVPGIQGKILVPRARHTYFPALFKGGFVPIDVVTLLRNNKNAFIEWRYMYEQGREGTPVGQLELVYRAVREHSIELKPEWRAEILHDNWTSQMAKGEKPTMKEPPI